MLAALYVDLKRCIGCDSCSVACKQENQFTFVGDQMHAGNNKWSKVYGAENDSYPKPVVQVLPMPCQQCNPAKCQETCDSLGYRAIKRRADGILWVDEMLCTGCQKCVPACPYKVMNFSTDRVNKLGTKGVAEKCHFCMHRLDQGLQPACVVTCVGITLEYGDLNTLRSKYPNAEAMGDDDKLKVLYGNLGEEPKRRTSTYPDPVPFHD